MEDLLFHLILKVNDHARVSNETIRDSATKAFAIKFRMIKAVGHRRGLEVLTLR